MCKMLYVSSKVKMFTLVESSWFAIKAFGSCVVYFGLWLGVNSLSWLVSCSSVHNNLMCSQIQCLKLFFSFLFGATAPYMSWPQ